jgi:nickel/cobalt transporter (NicO) family protein
MDHALLLTTAFGLGAAHALEPGHGKSLVTAYMAGSRGRVSDAFLLGLVAACCHTLSVLLIALAATWFIASFIGLKDSLFRSVETVSGVIVLAVGILMLLRLGHWHQSPDAGCHPHGACSGEHSLQPASLKDIFLLGLASGICPSPIPLVLLVSTLALGGLGHIAEALGYLFTFSLGLSSILVILGIALIVSRRYSLQWFSKNPRFPRLISQISACLVLGLGAYLIYHGIWGSPEP